MMLALLAGLAGGLVCVLVLRFLQPQAVVRRRWLTRLGLATLLGVVFWKLAPLWTRWETVFDQPLLLWSMNGGLAAWFGAGVSFLTVAALSLVQIRKEDPTVRRWTLLTPLAAGVLVFAVIGLQPVWMPAPGLDPGVALETPVPDLEGRPHVLADWKGKVVVLNFWATWCTPCLAELPEFREFHAIAPPNVAVVGVNALTTETTGLTAVVDYAVKNHLAWTQLTDAQGELQKAFSVTALPTTIVLSPEGRVVDRREGTVDLFWLKTLDARFGRP